MSVTEQQTESLLENVLFESSTQAAANAASWESNSAATSVASLATAMASSPEESIAAHVVGYYLSALGRAPTAAEIRYYVAVAEQGLTQSQIDAGQVAPSTWDTIANYFTHSPEFTSRAGLDYSLGQTSALFEAVPWLYESVLGRTPSGAELSYYDNQIASGAGLNTLFREFTASSEFATDTGNQIQTALAAYGATVASGQDPATIGASVTLGPPPPPVPPPAPTPSSPYVYFTTGTDTFTTTDSSLIYVATLGGPTPTLTPNDSLHGAGNTLNITDTSGPTSQDYLPAGASLTGVATITLTTSGNAGGSYTLNLSGVTGLTNFILDASGNQGDFIAVGTGVAVTIQTASANVDITTGFASLAITDNHLTSLDLTGTTGAITITDPSGPTSLAIDVAVDLNQSGNITDASNHITSITIAGFGTASNIGATVAGTTIADSALTTLTVTGDVNLGNPVTPLQLPASLTHFDATGDTGDSAYLSYQGSGATIAFGSISGYLLDAGGNIVTAGDNDNTLLTGGAGRGESITLGNGANYVRLNDGGGDTVTLGSGANTVVIAATYNTGIGDSITAGNGGNSVTLNSGAGGVTISLGNGGNTITDNGVGGNSITLGTGNNTVNLHGVGNDTITVGTDANYTSAPDTPNLTISNLGVSTAIVFSSLTTISGFVPTTGSISSLESLVTTANSVEMGTYGGNTYIVASASGTLGPSDTTIIEIIGTVTAFTVSGHTLTIS